MKSGWRTYKGKRYFYCDYRDFDMDLESLKEEVNTADECICKESVHSISALMDVSGTTGTWDIVEFFKKSAARTKPYIRRVAVVGLEGIRKLLADSVSRFSGQNFKAFDTLEEAKEWLIQS